jgi:hypothetical protein
MLTEVGSVADLRIAHHGSWAAGQRLPRVRARSTPERAPPAEQFLQGGWYGVTSNGDYTQGGETDTFITLALRSHRRV